MLLRFQLVSLSLICMSNDSANLLLGKDRIEMDGERLEDVLAGLLARGEVAALAKPQHHGEKAVLRVAVGDGVMLAADGADANAAERKNAGFHRGLAHDLDDQAISTRASRLAEYSMVKCGMCCLLQRFCRALHAK